jgi:hypothetical protein
MRNVKLIMQSLNERSIMPMQNRAAIERMIAADQPITFYNWECPPRFLDKTSEGQEFVNYDINLDKIFRGEALDSFTEIPRVVAERDDEIATLQWLNGLGVSYRFVKIIADTNAVYLTPESLAILGEGRVRQKFREFASRIQERLVDYPAKTDVRLFTDLIRPYQSLYDQSYQAARQMLGQNSSRLVDASVIKQQIERTLRHMGMRNSDSTRQFALNTIASYAAEGVVLDRLAEAILPNCVWLNNHEIDERTVAITNCLRVKRGIGPLPMVFVSYSHRKTKPANLG